MSAKVTLTITEGKLPGRQYIFDSRTSCIIGRAKDCNIKLPNDDDHSTISRYHCLLDINPPDIRIRDFGSRNGTYVNSKKIGQRQENQTPDEAAEEDFPEFDLQNGDEIKLSNIIVFAVSVESKPEEIKIHNCKITAKIGDYGLSKAFDLAGLSGQTMTGTRAGTPVFMPRQQVRDLKYAKPEVDVWATAASLYYMLTGYYPRNFTKKKYIFLAVLRNKPIPIRQRDKNIPKKLAEVIDLALEEEPEIYFKSAREFKEALLNIL